MGRAVIKAGDVVGAPMRGMHRLELHDIARQAETIIRAAKAEAARIVTEARQQADADRRTAQEAGHVEGRTVGEAEGRKAGYNEALAESREQFRVDQASAATALSEILAQVRGRQHHLYTEARRDVVVLSIVIASRVLRRLGEIEGALPEAAMDACRETLDRLGEVTEAVIRVHPEDLRAVSLLSDVLRGEFSVETEASAGGDANVPVEQNGHGSPRRLRIVGDQRLSRGDCVVEAGPCEVDGRLGSRVERVAEALVNAWRDRAEKTGMLVEYRS